MILIDDSTGTTATQQLVVLTATTTVSQSHGMRVLIGRIPYTMSRNAAERLGLKIVKVPANCAACVVEQVRPILEYHVNNFTPRLSIREQMERLAFDAYSQGLIHGNQVPKVEA